MKSRHIALVVTAGFAVAACETTQEATCRVPTQYEMGVFSSIVASDEASLAGYLSPRSEELAGRIEDMDPALQQQLFGYRFGDAAVKTVLIQPPLCVIDQRVSSTERITYIFPNERFSAIQNLERPGTEFGRAGIDHAACRFSMEDGNWALLDACMTTFGQWSPPEPEEPVVAIVEEVSEEAAAEAGEETAVEAVQDAVSEVPTSDDDVPAPVVEAADEPASEDVPESR